MQSFLYVASLSSDKQAERDKTRLPPRRKRDGDSEEALGEKEGKVRSKLVEERRPDDDFMIVVAVIEKSAGLRQRMQEDRDGKRGDGRSSSSSSREITL